MKSFYTSRVLYDNNGFDMSNETFNFYTLYLFIEKSQYYSLISHFVMMWNCRNSWEDSIIIQLHYFFKPDHSTNTMESMLKASDFFNNLKTKKYKDKADLKSIGQLATYVRMSKANVLWYFERFFRKSNIWEWIGLMHDDTTILLDYKSSDDFKDNEEDELIGLLQKAICDDSDFLFLDSQIETDFNAISIDKAGDTAGETGKSVFYKIPMFSFPICLNLAKDKMISLRTHMQEKIKTISGLNEEFKKTVNTEELNDRLKEKCKLYYKKILPEIQIMQQHIDKEIYFQQAVNSNEKHVSLTLNLGVATIATIIDYYEKTITLRPFVSAALKRQLAFKTDISKCDAFLYWSAALVKPFE